MKVSKVLKKSRAYNLAAMKPPLCLGFSATSMALTRVTYSTPPFRNLIASESLEST